MAANRHLGHEDHRGVGRVLHLPPPEQLTEAARRMDTISMERPWDPRYPEAEEELTYRPGDGSLLQKVIYTDGTKAHRLFTVDFAYDLSGTLSTKTVLRHEDGAVLVITFHWDVNQVLVGKTRDNTQPDPYSGL